MTAPRRLSELFGTAVTIIAVWVLVALFSSSETYNGALDTGYVPNQSWRVVTCHQLVVGLLWATITPLIIFIAERAPLVRPFRWRNTAVVIAVAPILALFRAAMGGAVLKLLEGAENLHELFEFVAFSINVRFPRNLFLTVAVFGIYNLVLAYRAAAAAERDALTAKKQIANDELQRLRGAIQPRFFFAALHTVKTHVTTAPMVADRMIVQFGAVLRKMLELEGRGDISLAEELEVVEQCFRLETTRTRAFSGRIAVDGSLLQARVPPLVLQTVVASATLIDGVEGGRLEIGASSSDGTLKLIVTSDTARRLQGSAVLETTEARLRRLFVDRASLEVSSSPDAEVVTMTMPLVMPRRRSGRFGRFTAGALSPLDDGRSLAS